jgi:hypothetical protein
MKKSPVKREDSSAAGAAARASLANQNRSNLLNSTVDGKAPRRAKLIDPWLEARLHYLSQEVTRLAAGPIAYRFLREAKQYARRHDPRIRVRVWQCLDVVADQLLALRRAGNSHREENPL